LRAAPKDGQSEADFALLDNAGYGFSRRIQSGLRAVIMCLRYLELMRPSIAARDVLLPAPGVSCDEDEAPWQVGQFLYDRGKSRVSREGIWLGMRRKQWRWCPSDSGR